MLPPRRWWACRCCYCCFVLFFLFLLLQCNSQCEKENDAKVSLFFFCYNATHSCYLLSVGLVFLPWSSYWLLLLCNCGGPFFVFYYWWCLFFICALFIFGRWKLKKKERLLPSINKCKLVLKMWLHWLWIGIWSSKCKLVLMLGKHLWQMLVELRLSYKKWSTW